MLVVNFLQKHFGIVLAAAVFTGLLLPFTLDIHIVAPYLRYLVMILLFTVFIKMDPFEIVEHLKKIKLLALVNISFLLVIPALVYSVLKPLGESIALAGLVLTAVPTGTAAPTLAHLIGGNTALTTSITITTSLLAPFTMPFLLGILGARHLQINSLELFESLAMIMFVPLVAAHIVHRLASRAVEHIRQLGVPINIVILFMLVYLAIASQRDLILQKPLTALWYGLIACMIMVILHLIGYYSVLRAGLHDRLGLSVSRAYMNISLAIVIAANFFPPAVLLLVVLTEIPWAMFPGLFHKYISQPLLHKHELELAKAHARQ